MPIKPSAFKALRQSRKRTERNHARKRVVKQLVKQSDRAIQAAEADALKKVQAACTAIDKAVQKGSLHANTGARKKSRLMKRLTAAVAKKA